MAGPQGTIPTPIISQPGIRKDGTRLSNLNYTDGQWVRFDKGVPRKMGGYSVLERAVSGLSRGLHLGAADGINWIHSGSFDKVELLRVSANGSIIAPVERTPSGIVSHEDNVWTFDAMQDQVDGTWKIIAHCAPNGQSIDNRTGGRVFIGELNDTAALTTVFNDSGGTTPLEVSGGCCAVHPFMFYFGNDGQAIWSVSNKPGNVYDTFNTGTNVPAGEARVTGAKIVAGRRMLGAGVPAVLLWSLDTLVRGVYVGGGATWDFDPLGTIEILAARSVVEYNGRYFWIGARRWQAMAGGGIQDVPNTFNQDWFFDNLNMAHVAKVYGFANPARGEIWWPFPKGDSEECNHAVILHVNSGIWYDTPLPHGGRSFALSPTSTYPYPLMAGVDVENDKYKLWQHETGWDEIDGNLILPVRSYFVTSDITFLRSQQPSDASVEVMDLEPDFLQKGDMTVTVVGNANARAPVEISAPLVIPEPGAGVEPEHQVIELKEERRQMRFKFESNTQGGMFEAGTSYAHIIPTGKRRTT